MKDKHRKTLANIFKKPVQSGIPWKDIEAMLKAHNAEISEGEGSRIRIKLNGFELLFIGHILKKKQVRVRLPQ